MIFATGFLIAQEVPRAQPVDPALNADAENDFYLRGKNLYDSAQDSAVQENRVDLYQRAAAIFEQYLNDFPRSPNAEPALFYLGSSLYQSGRVNDGKRCFSTLLNRFGNSKWSASAAYILAADYYNKAEYAAAAPLFERFASNTTKPEERVRGNYLAGVCYRIEGSDRQAIAAYQKVIQDPAGGLYAPQSKIAIGSFTLKDGKLLEALAIFEEVAAGPHSAKIRGEAALQAAITATKLDKTDLSEKYLQLILSTAGMEDFRLDAQIAYMKNLFVRKDYTKVIKTFRSSSETAKGEKEATRLMYVARSYMKLKQPADALQLFREVEKLLDPDSELAIDAAYNRLLCFSKSKDVMSQNKWTHFSKFIKNLIGRIPASIPP